MAKIGDFFDIESFMEESKKLEEKKEEAKNLADDLAAFKAAMGE